MSHNPDNNVCPLNDPETFMHQATMGLSCRCPEVPKQKAVVCCCCCRVLFDEDGKKIWASAMDERFPPLLANTDRIIYEWCRQCLEIVKAKAIEEERGKLLAEVAALKAGVQAIYEGAKLSRDDALQAAVRMSDERGRILCRMSAELHGNYMKAVAAVFDPK